MTSDLAHRVIPVLLLRDGGLVKTQKFCDGPYIGDPINAIRIFNDLRVDELLLLDIDATRRQRGPDLELLADLADEAFMPLGYGGGVQTVEQCNRILRTGFEKVAINHNGRLNPEMLRSAANEFGEQSVVGAFDVKHGLFGKNKVYDHVRGKATDLDPVEHAQDLVAQGAGEIFMNSVDRDGTMKGMDLELIESVSRSIHAPLVACGGAGTIPDIMQAAQAGASGVGAGSLFVFRSKQRGVLINYPNPEEIERIQSVVRSQ